MHATLFCSSLSPGLSATPAPSNSPTISIRLRPRRARWDFPATLSTFPPKAGRPRVPNRFLVHASGGKEKHFAKNADMEFRFEQTAADLNPFVVAGRYRETHQDLPGNQRLRIWSRTDVTFAQLQQAAESLAKTLAVYDSLFATRNNARPPLWI